MWILTEPDHIDTVTPLGQIWINPGDVIALHAERYVNCPEVWEFDHWQPEGEVDDAYDPNTTTIADCMKIITAVYVDARVCGDECHPIIPADLEPDCIINLRDFIIIARHWLESTHPDDD